MRSALLAGADRRWLLFIHQIPLQRSYFRVKTWRRLQRLGAVAIKNSVYLLPKREQAHEDLQWLRNEIIKGGGDGSIGEGRFVARIHVATRNVRRLAPLAVWLLLCRSLAAQTEAPPTKVFTLPEAVECAVANYPAVRAALERSAAARAGVTVAQLEYLPRTDLLWQENRATRNNISGVMLPQSVIPTITGPVLESNSYASMWGSAAGALFSWEPFDFGRRAAAVDLARAASAQAQAGVEITQLDVGTAAADAFLAAGAADETRRAAQANVDRMQVFGTSVHTLVRHQLRPGADASRADAELAAARNQLIQAETLLSVRRASLAEALGMAGSDVAVELGPLLHLPGGEADATVRIQSHPLAAAEAAAVDTIRARQRVLARSYFPRLHLQAAGYARGSGALADGRLTGGSSGLRPDTANWASGVSVTFPVFDLFAIHAERNVEASREAAEQATYEQTLQRLSADDARTTALLDGARRFAANTPIQLQAAQAAEAQARARYKASLVSVTEVAEAQRLLAQAEADDAVARLGVWRAELAAAHAHGDLAPFLRQVIAAAPAGGS